jgi:hypothetical protein
MARSIPDKYGMTTSVSNTSGDPDGTFSRAFNGSVKALTVKPSRLRIKASVSEILISSSTTKIWMSFSSGKDHPPANPVPLQSTETDTSLFVVLLHDMNQKSCLRWRVFFMFSEYLVWPNLSLFIQKLRREEDGQAFFEVNHNACGQPF